MWHAAALGVALWLLLRGKRGGGPAGLMSQYFKAPDGRCMFKPVGQTSYEITCAEWELGVKAETEEFLNGGGGL